MVAALRAALEFELMRGHIDEITAEQQVAIVAAVGDRMRGTPGIAATVFGALGSAGSISSRSRRVPPSGTFRSSSPTATPVKRFEPSIGRSGSRRPPSELALREHINRITLHLAA